MLAALGERLWSIWDYCGGAAAVVVAQVCVDLVDGLAGSDVLPGIVVARCSHQIFSVAAVELVSTRKELRAFLIIAPHV
jgi:hypothetical protein